MARETIYMLQTMELVAPKRFRFDRPTLFDDLRKAMSAVEETRGKHGAIIHRVTGDPTVHEYETPVVVHVMGQLPVGLVPVPKRTTVVVEQPAEQRRTYGARAFAPQPAMTVYKQWT